MDATASSFSTRSNAKRAAEHYAVFVGGCGRGRLGPFRAGRHGEELARLCDVGGAIAIGEQSVMADAVQALGQHVRQPRRLRSAGDWRDR